MTDKEGVEGVDEWKNRIQQDVTDLKTKYSQVDSDNRKQDKDIQELKVSDQLQKHEIDSLRKSINEIKEDTNYIRTSFDKDREDQLKQYKNMGWKIVGAVILAFILVQLGLN